MHLKRLAALLLFVLPIAACVAAPESTGSDSDVASASEDLKVCNGPLPQYCEVCSDGSTGCAHWVIKDHKCTIETCPKTHECDEASDCHGALPDLCEVCSDGSDGCAHFECKHHACKTVFCD